MDHRVPRGKRNVAVLVAALGRDRHAHGGDEIARHRMLRILEEARVREARPDDVLCPCFTLVKLEAHLRRGAHLDRRAAALRIALRVVPVAHRIECAVHRHRHEELRSLCQLLHVRVAAVLARRDRAQALITQVKKTSPTVNFYSNVNGYLSELNISEGEYVSTGTPLFKIASLETVWVNAEIYQNEVSYLFQNPEIELEFEALPNEIFKGQIILNPPAFDTDKKISSVKIRVQNTNDKIKPGMMATVSVKRNQKRTLVIPKSALVLSKKISVWIEIKPGMYEIRMVKPGIENKIEVEILSGIDEGDKVVSSGVYLLNSAFILKKGANSMGGMKM